MEGRNLMNTAGAKAELSAMKIPPNGCECCQCASVASSNVANIQLGIGHWNWILATIWGGELHLEKWVLLWHCGSMALWHYVIMELSAVNFIMAHFHR